MPEICPTCGRPRLSPTRAQARRRDRERDERIRRGLELQRQGWTLVESEKGSSYAVRILPEAG